MTFTQLKSLHRYYKINSFPNADARENIAKNLGMTPRCVQVWFQNQRQKEKNEKRNQQKKETERWEGLMLLANAAVLVSEMESEGDMNLKRMKNLTVNKK